MVEYQSRGQGQGRRLTSVTIYTHSGLFAFDGNAVLTLHVRMLSQKLFQKYSQWIIFHHSIISYLFFTAIYKATGISERSSYNILPMEGLAGKITNSLHESIFACYNCISNITICGGPQKKTDYPSDKLQYKATAKSLVRYCIVTWYPCFDDVCVSFSRVSSFCNVKRILFTALDVCV